MNYQLPVEYSEPPATPAVATGAGPSGADQAGAGHNSEAGGAQGPSDDAARHEATILVRGEAIHDQESKQAPKDSAHADKQRPSRKEVSEAKLAIQNRLPALDDDGDVGALKEHIVIRDGTADIAFTGKLIASAAPAPAPTDHWMEYRIYETNGGKHVFSKVTRSVLAAEEDTHQAEIFDPSPSSMPAKLLRGARDLTRSEPLTWMDAAAAFFGYDPLAKALYRKLGGQFEEHVV